MKSVPDVSIIVSNYNSSDLLNDALASIVQHAGDVAFDVMVLDDASTDGGFARVDEKYKNDPRFLFVQNEKNIGFSALNIALDRMHGTYLMTLDTDARLWAGALEALVHFMQTNPSAGAATANLHNVNGSIQNYHRRLLTPIQGFFMTVPGRFIDKYFLGLRFYKSYHYCDLDTTRVFELEQPPTACLILRREALGSRILDPDFHIFIDVDLCRRIYNRGYKIYLVPDANVTHIKSVSFNKMNHVSRERKYYKSQYAYFRKNYPVSAPFMWLVLWLDRVLRSLLEHTVGHVPMR